MHPGQHDCLDETNVIVEAIRKVQADPDLEAEARTNLPGVLDRLGLRGVARHAVASALALGFANLAAVHAVTPQSFWID